MTGFRPTVAVDFDGVIHRYSKGWQDGVIYDPPVDGTFVALNVLATRHKVVIYTVRDDLNAVWEWLKKYGLHIVVSEVTNLKPIAHLYIDDRAYRFEGDWTKALADVEPLLA